MTAYRVKPWLACALLGTSALCKIPAFAADAPEQPAAAPASAAPSDPDVKDIVVTAQRRRESVQSVNIAVTALSGDALTEKRVTRALDLQTAAPGITISRSGITDSFNIRGIGLASASPQVTNGVATYIDGVFQTPIVSNGQFYDMAGAEVLRGPQGTLSGANSTGGAVYLTTQRPQLGKLGGYASANYGNYNNAGINGALNLPVGDNFAIRASGLFNRHDAWFKDIGPAKNQPERLNEIDGRVQALWKLGGFQANLKVEAVQRRTGGFALQPINTTLANNPYVVGRTNTPWTVSYDSPVANFERAFTTMLEAKYQFDGGLTLRSVTAYQNKRLAAVSETDATSINPTNWASYPALAALGKVQNQVVGANNVRERVYSQEINIISPDSGAFKYVLGGYAQRNKIDLRNWNSTNGAFTTLPQPMTNKVLLGVFGQASYQLAPKFSVDAGLRYSHFHVDGFGAVYRAAPGSTITQVMTVPPVGASVLVPQTGNEGDGRMTGKLALNFKPDADNLLFVFAARGYKNGGINPPGGSFRPETVWDYEAGWKSSFFDRRLKTQIGAFYMKYNNFQMDVINPLSGQSGVVNLANSDIKGFEASFQGKFDALSVDGGLSFVDSSLSALSLVNKWAIPAGVSTPQCNPAGTPGTVGNGCFNYVITSTSGGPNLYSPKWTWNVSAAYRIDLGGERTLTPRLGYAYIGSQWAYPTYQAATDLIAARGLLQGSITLDMGGFKAEVYGTNLANKFYVAGQNGKNELYGAPREYGVRFSKTF
ncbi:MULTISPECIES: TonB-dependent receptor [unclassified Novosphingobium]|uniref:TonB-dependent receptor n=1 Tax=unclassified Novosphingobium TaxID=2644732 RepID=UPI001493F035|nr:MULTISPECIES: TonB-dependent receptor [unclassified Novosphingobium]MBB3357406.1 iron complex outermembrane receptor protein [Novosphingobium sp. BK256]MBB3373932.1 iron complex outermembrane receptor protein [Novosphingobium sp. BK280]MBB3378344.1 iron complex outermembrane receptor protein [Novosphingobium sp. BK258]MBB3419872.1 iron complex outermembrane receptor protein [Novosphingobium sp. BK267]MBB3447807.1 iron complex outermembrane receptor protein [Novosphingobium sp. BK352]